MTNAPGLISFPTVLLAFFKGVSSGLWTLSIGVGTVMIKIPQPLRSDSLLVNRIFLASFKSA